MYNIGIVGTSFIADEFIEAVSFIEGMKVVALYSRTETSGQKFIGDKEIDLYTDYEKMLINTNIDIIYIATPNSLHYEQAFKAIEHGKHVFVEKPITLKSEELKELYIKAFEKNVLVMEGIVNIFYDNFKIVKEWIDKIGEVQFVNFNLQQQTRHFKDYKAGKVINVFTKKLGGGALRDLGPYPLYPLVSLFGMPNKVNYYKIANLEKIDESTMLICEYNGFNASINVSKVVKDPRENIISGTNGYILIEHINHFEKVKLYDVTGKLLESITLTYEHRMCAELIYFKERLTKDKKVDKKIINASLNVCEIIEGNYTE